LNRGSPILSPLSYPEHGGNSFSKDHEVEVAARAGYHSKEASKQVSGSESLSSYLREKETVEVTFINGCEQFPQVI
jgi:hypothetical protein